jgi:membrane-associated phospholipid phosphatase
VSALFPWQQSAVFDGLLRQQLTAGSNATTKPPPPRVRDSIRDLATALVAKTTPSNAWVDFNFAPSGTLWAYQKSMPMQNFTFMPQLGQSTPVVSPAARLDAIVANTDSRRGRVFRPPTTPARTVDYETTYRLGSANSTERDAYDTASASFWAAGANTTAIGGMWLDIALQALPESTTVAETALFLARAFGAAYDAGIAAYKLKYSVLQWRPISAFRVGYPKQGPIPAFAPDPAWTPLLMTPPHPDYPSGHSSTVGAVLEVLLRTLGLKNDGTKWDSIATTARSESNPQAGERSYPSLTAAATEVGDSRVYAGVHFNHSCADALALGRLVGGEAFEALKPAAGGLLSPRRIFGR